MNKLKQIQIVVFNTIWCGSDFTTSRAITANYFIARASGCGGAINVTAELVNAKLQPASRMSDVFFAYE